MGLSFGENIKTWQKIGDTSFNNMEQVHMEYWDMDIMKVNVFIFLNEEAEEFTSRWSQSFAGVRSPCYLK